MQRINCVLQLSFEKALPPLKQVSVPLPHQMQEKLLVLVFQIMCGMRERLGEFVLAADVFDCWQSFFLSKLSRGYEARHFAQSLSAFFVCSATPLLSRLLA